MAVHECLLIVTPRPLRPHQVRPLTFGPSGIRTLPDTAAGRVRHTMDDMNEQSGPHDGQSTGRRRTARPAAPAGQQTGPAERAPRQRRADARRQPAAPQQHRPLHRRRRRRPRSPLRHRPDDHPRAARRAHLLRRRRPAGLRRRLAVRARGRPGPCPDRARLRDAQGHPHRRGRDRPVDRLRHPLLRRRLGLAFPFPLLVIGLVVPRGLRHPRPASPAPDRNQPPPPWGSTARPAHHPGRNHHDRHRHPHRPGPSQPPAWMPPPTPPTSRRRRGRAAPVWCCSGRPSR